MELRLSSIVVLGQGFTPHLIGPQTLASVLGSEAKATIISPPITIIDYPTERYQVMVREDRIDVKRQRPPAGSDAAMQKAVRELLQKWPLITPGAIGINFELGAPYGEDLTQEALTSRVTAREVVESAFDNQLVGSKHAFVFWAGRAKLTVQVTTDAVVAERPGFTVDYNAHYQDVSDVEEILQSQADWYENVAAWSEALIYGG